MGIVTKCVVAISLLALSLQVQGQDKYTDENRPYEFGFNIEGEQHRHEKKDENGIIMGEFGFITADGVYHVTAYATDENGNFKILSTKNLRLKSFPQQKKGHSLELPPANNQQQQPAPEQAPSLPVQSCSSCSIPAPTPDQQYNNQQYPDTNDFQQNYQQEQFPQYDTANQQGFDYQNQNNQQDFPQYPDQNQDQQLQSGVRDPKQYEPNLDNLQPTDRPTLISAQMNIVDPNTDIYQRGPGEQEGLPQGVSMQDVDKLLYVFTYRTSFHGHHEEGFANGSKKGYYFVTGRNGAKTRIDYEADENGFRPKITTEVLDLLSEDVPKEETEKDEKYGLKEYEFRWLYYPLE